MKMKINLHTLLPFIVLCLEAVSTFGLYGVDFPENDVETFGSRSEFKIKVLDSQSIWLVQFYAPWCGVSSIEYFVQIFNFVVVFIVQEQLKIDH